MKCNYPKCQNEIREEDKTLKPQTAKLCETHNQKMEKLIEENNIPKLVSFMMIVSFSNLK
jgi:hypothetical protein